MMGKTLPKVSYKKKIQHQQCKAKQQCAEESKIVNKFSAISCVLTAQKSTGPAFYKETIIHTATQS
jgi:hypothetical protein